MQVRRGGGQPQWTDLRYQKLNPTPEEHLLDTMRRVDDLEDRVETLEETKEAVSDVVKWVWKEIVRFLVGAAIIAFLIQYGKISADRAADIVRELLRVG